MSNEKQAPPKEGSALTWREKSDLRFKAAVELVRRGYADQPEQDPNVGLDVALCMTRLSSDDELCARLAREYDRHEALRLAVKNLPAEDHDRQALQDNLSRYLAEILARPEVSVANDLEALRRLISEGSQP